VPDIGNRLVPELASGAKPHSNIIERWDGFRVHGTDPNATHISAHTRDNIAKKWRPT